MSKIIDVLFGFKNFNDRLALLLVLSLPIFWIIVAIKNANVSGEILGATVMAWGLIIQYYFRRSPPTTPPTE